MTYTLDTSLLHLLHRAAQSANDLFAKEQSEGGLTSRQLVVLAAIAENEGLSQTGIVSRTGVDRSTLADVVRRLLKKGLVVRRRTKDDARAYAVKLTTEGQNLLADAGATAMRTEEKLLSGLSASNRRDLIRLLRTLADTAAGSEPSK
ncbi:MAG: MarR family transcriptional regulator [Hyphomicrobiaceae bacterium]